MNTPIRELLNYYYTLSWFNFIFLKLRRKEKLELTGFVILCFLAVFYAIFKFPMAAGGDDSFNVTIGIFLFIFAFICVRWVYFDQKIEKQLRSKYPEYVNSSDKFDRYALKVRLLKKELQRLDCYAKEPIDAVINVLKYEASVPVYRSTWPKVLSALFFVILGAYITFFADISPKDVLDPLIGLMKVTSALLFMVMSCVFVLEVTPVKLVADWKMRSKYHVELIRFLEEIRWDIMRLKSERSPDHPLMQKHEIAGPIPKIAPQSHEPQTHSVGSQAKS